MAMPPAGTSRTGPRVAQLPQFTVGGGAPRGSAAHVANHLGDKRRQRGFVGEMACVVDATAPPGASLAHEPPTMRVNPMTRTPTPRYAPERRPRIPSDPRTKCRTQAHTIGPTREVSGPRANQRTHARGEERKQLARSEQFRMQFDWVNFQQRPQTLQSQQYGCAVRHSAGELHATFVG